MTKGYSDSALWLKINIPGTGSTSEIAIVVRPAFLRGLELYDPELEENGPDPAPLVSGRDAPIVDKTYIGLDNGFIIKPSQHSRDVFIRVKSTTSLTVDLAVMPLAKANRYSHYVAGFVAIFVAFLMSFWLWSVVTWSIRRESLFGFFALRQFYATLHVFVYFGGLRFFGSEVLDSGGKNVVHTLTISTIIVASGYFDMRLISEFKPSHRLRKVITALLCLPLLSVALLAADQTLLALQFATMLVLVVMALLVLFAFTTTNPDRLPLGGMAMVVIRVGYAAMGIVVIVPILMLQNLIPVNVSAVQLTFLQSIMSTIVLFSLLSIRNRQRDFEARDAIIKGEIAQADWRRETALREEKESFLSMLTHELRNPLSVIRLMTSGTSAGAVAVQKAATEMARLIERVEQSERMDEESLHGEKARIDVGDEIRKLAQELGIQDQIDIHVTGAGTALLNGEMFRSILRNLLENAAKYSAVPSRIGVSVEPAVADGPVDGLQVEVTNEIGNSGAPDVQLLFTKYYRTKGAHRHPGSGLGLYLVSRWTKTLGWQIAYRPDGGPDRPRAVFSLWVPL